MLPDTDLVAQETRGPASDRIAKGAEARIAELSDAVHVTMAQYDHGGADGTTVIHAQRELARAGLDLTEPEDARLSFAEPESLCRLLQGCQTQIQPTDG